MGDNKEIQELTNEVERLLGLLRHLKLRHDLLADRVKYHEATKNGQIKENKQWRVTKLLLVCQCTSMDTPNQSRHTIKEKELPRKRLDRVKSTGQYACPEVRHDCMYNYSFPIINIYILRNITNTEKGLFLCMHLKTERNRWE